MKNLKIFLLILFLSGNALSQEDKGGFYSGIDPVKTNNKIGHIDNAVSVDAKIDEDHYYGYKFGDEGFFVAPEVFMKNGSKLDNTRFSTDRNGQSGSPDSGVTYDMKANFGYDFNRSFSGFVTYDVGSFAYNPGQKTVAVGSNLNNNSAVGIGSQINLSNNLGLKMMYSKQQLNNSNATNSGQIKSDTVKVGTVYSF